MEKIIKVGDKYFEEIDSLNFYDTKHIIARYGENVIYLNYKHDTTRIPPINLEVKGHENDPVYLYEIRKQYFLNGLIDYIRYNQIINNKTISEIVNVFKNFIDESDVQMFMYGGYITEDDFKYQKNQLINRLDLEIDEKINGERKHER